MGENSAFLHWTFLSLWKAADRSLPRRRPRSLFYDDLDSEVAAAVEEALQVLDTLSAHV